MTRKNGAQTAALLVVIIGLVAGIRPVAAATPAPRLGTALNFAVLAGQTITNTGPTVISGNLGLHPGTSVTGFPPGTVTGVKHITDGVALQAKNDLVTAYTDAASAPSTSNLSGKDLGGQNLSPGVYTFSSSAQLTGPLTLSGSGVFIFQIGSALTTASNSTVLLRNGAEACSVYWKVGSSATLGSATQFQGNLMALDSITMVTGANIITGRALARNAALTLDTNRITPPSGSCGGVPNAGGPGLPRVPGSPGIPGAPDSGAGGFTVAGLGLVTVGCLMLAVGRRRRLSAGDKTGE